MYEIRMLAHFLELLVVHFLGEASRTCWRFQISMCEILLVAHFLELLVAHFLEMLVAHLNCCLGHLLVARCHWSRLLVELGREIGLAVLSGFRVLDVWFKAVYLCWTGALVLWRLWNSLVLGHLG